MPACIKAGKPYKLTIPVLVEEAIQHQVRHIATLDLMEGGIPEPGAHHLLDADVAAQTFLVEDKLLKRDPAA